MSDEVAVLGAGPSGLVAARWLRSQGMQPVLFEAHDGPGGQWDHRNPLSGVWAGMRTNTARMVTRFSDLDFPDEVGMFPRHTEMLDYLRTYAQRFDLLDDTHFGCTVTALDRHPDGGYRLGWRDPDGRLHERGFHRVVVATGRYNDPVIPRITGLHRFTGSGGVVHTFGFADPTRYRDRRVLVAGGNISALEIACDLAALGATVTVAARRQRWVIPKVIAGTPVESYSMTRGAALAAEGRSPAENDAALLDFLHRYAGDPARYGAPAPHPDIRLAGTTRCQHFPTLVAEHRIRCRPWIADIAGTTVTFTDGSTTEVDAIIAGTGFRLHLPFLSDDLARTLTVDDAGLDLAHFTFHPDLPGLAFVGLWAQLGPYPAVLEQQARYLAYTWGGAIPGPGDGELAAALAAGKAAGLGSAIHGQPAMAIRFGRLAGTDPGGLPDPELQAVLDGTAVTAPTFRLTGVDALPDAADTVRREAVRWGRVPGT